MHLSNLLILGIDLKHLFEVYSVLPAGDANLVYCWTLVLQELSVRWFDPVLGFQAVHAEFILLSGSVPPVLGLV